MKWALYSAILTSGFSASSNCALQPYDFVQRVLSAPWYENKDVVTGVLITKTLERNVHIKVQMT